MLDGFFSTQLTWTDFKSVIAWGLNPKQMQSFLRNCYNIYSPLLNTKH